MNNSFHRIKPKHIIILTAVIFLALVAFFIYQTIDRANKIQITINLVPKDSKITLNGVTSSNGINYVLPGKYSVKVSKDGFGTVDVTDNLTKNGDEIDIALNPQSSAAQEWAQKNDSLYATFEGILGDEAKKEGADFLEHNPITKYLPEKNYLYTISYQTDSSDPTGSSIIITIDTSEQYRQAAISQIEKWGYNLADFNYEISDFSNPFNI